LKIFNRKLEMWIIYINYYVIYYYYYDVIIINNNHNIQQAGYKRRMNYKAKKQIYRNKRNLK